MRAPLHAMLVITTGCASALPLQTSGLDGRRFVIEGTAPEGTPGHTMTLRPEVCDGYDLRPDYGALNEARRARSDNLRPKYGRSTAEREKVTEGKTTPLKLRDPILN